jgi:hypothetical protein
MTWRELSTGPNQQALLRRHGAPITALAHHAETRRIASASAVPGGAVQVDAIKPTLKSPGTKRLLKLKYDEPLSNFATACSLRRYTPAPTTTASSSCGTPPQVRPSKLRTFTQVICCRLGICPFLESTRVGSLSIKLRPTSLFKKRDNLLNGNRSPP